MERTSEAKMNTTVIVGSIKGGANGPVPSTSNEDYRFNGQNNKMLGQYGSSAVC